MENQVTNRFDYKSALIELARKLLSANKLIEAQFWLQRLGALFPDTVEPLLMSADLHSRLGNREVAIELLHKATQLESSNLSIKTRYFDQLMRNGQVAAAYHHIFELHKKSPENGVICRCYARALSANKRFAEAIKLLLHRATTDPGDPLNYSALAEVWMDSGNFENVERLIALAFRLQKGCRMANAALLRYFDLTGKGEIGSIKMTVDNDPNTVEELVDVTLLAAKVKHKLGMHNHARHMVKEIAALWPHGRLIAELNRDRTSQLHSRRPYQRRQLVFVSQFPRYRMINIARAMAKNGWQVVLICFADGIIPADPCFTEIRTYRDEEEALQLAFEYNPRAYHIFSGNADPIAVTILKTKPGFVIFDPYDFLEGLIKSDYVYNVGQMQRYCIEHSDAITARDLRLRYQKRALGYRLPQRVIFFPDYCIEPKIAPSLQDRNPKEIHVAACGWFATNRASHEADWGYLEIGKRLATQGVHLHLYLHPAQVKSPNFQDQFHDYFRFQQSSRFFHLHQPVGMSELSTELGKYHFGINATYATTPNIYKGSYTDAMFTYCLSARNIEYLDAGLPLILNGDLHCAQWSMFNRFGVAVNTSEAFFNNADRILRNFLADSELPSKINRCQRKYALENHTERLNRFYEGIPDQNSLISIPVPSHVGNLSARSLL